MRMSLLFLSVVVSVTATAKAPSQADHRTLKKATEFDLPGPAGKRHNAQRPPA